MARHRINEDGHMIWFDSDEEYENYLYEKELIEQEARREEELENEKINKMLRIALLFFVTFACPLLLIPIAVYFIWKRAHRK